MSRFPDAAHFASWLNLCPQNKITGGKIISSKTGPATNRTAQVLRMATQALYRMASFAANAAYSSAWATTSRGVRSRFNSTTTHSPRGLPPSRSID